MSDVRLLSPAQVRQRIPELASILAACVHAGASVSFMEPFSEAEAVGYFAEIAEEVATGARAVFAAFENGRPRGTVQLILRLPPNQPHRAEIAKLLVHPQARRHGLGRALMTAAETHALALGRTLLTMDTAGEEADALYRGLGYTAAGIIPGYALFPDGRPCDTTIFWKRI